MSKILNKWVITEHQITPEEIYNLESKNTCELCFFKGKISKLNNGKPILFECTGKYGVIEGGNQQKIKINCSTETSYITIEHTHIKNGIDEYDLPKIESIHFKQHGIYNCVENILQDLKKERCGNLNLIIFNQRTENLYTMHVYESGLLIKNSSHDSKSNTYTSTTRSYRGGENIIQCIREKNGFIYSSEEYTYNKNDQLTCVHKRLKSENGNETKECKEYYTYDERDNKILTTTSNGFIKEMKYDENGNMIEEKDNTGNLTTWKYENGILVESCQNSKTIRHEAVKKESAIKRLLDVLNNKDYLIDITWR